MYSKIPYIVPVKYRDGTEMFLAFMIRTLRMDGVGYRGVLGYYKVKEGANKIAEKHAERHDKSLPCPKYK